MLITPRSGADSGNILTSLQHVATAVSNLWTARDPQDRAHTHLLKYLDWATDSVDVLRHHVSSEDLDRLVLTRRYYNLLDAAGRLNHDHQIFEERLVNKLVSLEIQERIVALAQAMATLERTVGPWSKDRTYVVPDTSWYIQHPVKFADVDLHDVLGLPAAFEIRLLVPMVVLDELDKLKESGKKRARWRSGHTLGVLDELLGDDGVGILRQRVLPGLGAHPDEYRGEVTIEVVFDSPDHVRLPIDDDELVARTRAIESLAGRTMILLTYDTGQATRGRMAGLTVRKLAHEAGTGEEPDWAAEEARQEGNGSGVRAQRRARQAAKEAAAAVVSD